MDNPEAEDISGALCTLEDVWDYLKADRSDDDRLLRRLILSVSNMAEVYCSRRFAVTQYTQSFYPRGSGGLYLDNGPVVSISSISLDGQPFAADRYDLDASMVRLRAGWGWAGCKVVVTYMAGYTETPPAVRQAVIETVALRYREKPRLGMSSRALEGASESFTIDAFTVSGRTALNMFRKVTL